MHRNGGCSTAHCTPAVACTCSYGVWQEFKTFNQTSDFHNCDGCPTSEYAARACARGGGGGGGAVKAAGPNPPPPPAPSSAAQTRGQEVSNRQDGRERECSSPNVVAPLHCCQAPAAPGQPRAAGGVVVPAADRATPPRAAMTPAACLLCSRVLHRHGVTRGHYPRTLPAGKHASCSVGPPCPCHCWLHASHQWWHPACNSEQDAGSALAGGRRGGCQGRAAPGSHGPLLHCTA